MHRAFLILTVAGLGTILFSISAQEPSPSPSTPAGEEDNANERCDCPRSPDGKFAFHTSDGEDSFGNAVHMIDLIDRKSGKKLQRIDEENMPGTFWHVLWAPDSNRFASMTRMGHPNQGVDVYFRGGETFRKLDLSKLPEANIPEKLKHGKKFPHVAAQNWQEAKEWEKDGSLVITVDTTIDGEGTSIIATCTVVLGFDRSGNAEIVRSTIKYHTENY